jgi:hypothetical protein
MPYLKTPETIQSTVIAALERFATDPKTKPVTMAVLWFEPPHGCWGLYLSTQENAHKSTPTEFDYQNYEVGDVEDADATSGDKLYAEVDAFTRRLALAVPDAWSPKHWGVQVEFDYFATWETEKNR